MDLWLICLMFMLFTHWIADFVIQGDDIVRGTAGVNYITEHCLKYAVAFPAGAWFTSLFLLDASFNAFLIFSLINVLTHTLIDLFAIPLASGFFKKKNIRNGSISLALDQLLHSIVIISSFYLCFLKN